MDVTLVEAETRMSLLRRPSNSLFTVLDFLALCSVSEEEYMQSVAGGLILQAVHSVKDNSNQRK